MAIKELERERTGDTVPQKKKKPRQEWNVVMQDNSPFPLSCALCILRNVFNISSADAMIHLQNARKNGAEPVFQSSKDVVDAKTVDALKERDLRAAICSPHVAHIVFRSEPL